uniref:Uncharacterized protein n=1 Tax=Meloidogyne enterolobii TaxID=390850 RepID=A0A6V7UZ38_MELEN|nr:unnamed protein product [Meloidogyne enterolobii]
MKIYSKNSINTRKMILEFKVTSRERAGSADLAFSWIQSPDQGIFQCSLIESGQGTQPKSRSRIKVS